VTVTIRDRTYDPAYDDINSPKSRALIVELTAIIGSFCRRTFRFFVTIRIIRFFPGSVGVDYDLVFQPTSTVTSNSIVEEFQKANATKELEFLVLGRLSAREVVPTTPPTLPTGKIYIYIHLIEVRFFPKISCTGFIRALCMLFRDSI